MRKPRDFQARDAGERSWILANTWCGSCGQADLGMTDPAEFETGGVVFVEGRCRRCRQTVIAEVAVDSPGESAA